MISSKSNKKCEKPSIKTSKTTSHYSAKSRWNQRQEVSNFSLDPQNSKKKKKTSTNFNFTFRKDSKKHSKNLRENREKLSILCYARRRTWPPTPRHSPKNIQKAKLFSKKQKGTLSILTTNLRLSKKNSTINYIEMLESEYEMRHKYNG